MFTKNVRIWWSNLHLIWVCRYTQINILTSFLSSFSNFFDYMQMSRNSSILRVTISFMHFSSRTSTTTTTTTVFNEIVFFSLSAISLHTTTSHSFWCSAFQSVFGMNLLCVRLCEILFDLDKWVYVFVWHTDKMQYFGIQWGMTGSAQQHSRAISISIVSGVQYLICSKC